MRACLTPSAAPFGASTTSRMRFDSWCPLDAHCSRRSLIAAAFGHFSHQTVAYAAQQGVPFADIAVPLSGLLAMAGGLSVLLGYHARIGAWLLVLFLLPVTFMMHRFWAVSDPMMVAIQQAMFMKNLSMLGGALLVAYFGAGPFSIDARQGRDVR